MAIDLNEVSQAETAGAYRRQGDASANFMAMLDRMFLKVYTEPDALEAAAPKEIQRAQSQFPAQGVPGPNPAAE